MKRDLEIEKVFTEEVFIGDSLVCMTLISVAENALKDGADIYFKVKADTSNGIVMEGVGIGASMPLDEVGVSDNIKEFVYAAKVGKKVRVDIVSTMQDWYDNGEVIKFRFVVYKENEVYSHQGMYAFNPFTDKCRIPVKRMTVTELQENDVLLKNEIHFVRERKKKGEDIIYKVDLFEKGLALRSVSYDTGGSSPFTIESEKVGKYYHHGYDIYARIKEIDDSVLDYCGMASIKYDIIVLDVD